MSLRLIIGRSGSGKTDLCLNEINKKQQYSKRLIYIVPEQYSLQAERELVNATGGIISAVVLSFRRLAENIFLECGISADKQLTDMGKLMILRRILMQNKNNFKYFGVVCERQGFIDRVSQSMTEFFAGGISAEDLKRYADSFDKESALYNKLNDMALIYSEYCNFIKREYITEDDILTIASEKMRAAAYIKDAEVWIDGFYGFTYQEYQIIDRLLSACKRINVTLTMDMVSAEGNNLTMEDSFFEPWDTMQRLKKLCTESGYNIEKNTYLNEIFRYKSEGMRNVEKEYFGYKVNKIKPESTGIKLFTALDINDEISMCASEIIHLVRDKGLRYRDIALTTRELNSYEEVVRLVFSHYGIPYFMDSKRSVMGHPCTEFLRAVVEMTADNISYESIFRCLKTELTSINREDRDVLENYVLRYGIKGDTWINTHWQWGFEKEKTTDKENIINDLKEAAIEPFVFFYEKYRTGKHTVKEITIDLYEIMENLGIADRLEQRAEKDEAEGNSLKAQEHIRCFELVGELLENMVSLLGDDKVTIREYSQILESGLSVLKMGIIPECVDSIIIGDIERTRLPDIKALFIVGVNEGVLPSSDTDIKGILSERERIAMENAGAELSHSGARLAFEEQYLIYMGITKPSEYLYICRNRTDSSGRETRPSSVISRLEKIFGNLEMEEFNDKTIKAIDRPVPVLHRLGEHIVKGKYESFLWQEAAKWLINNNIYRDRAIMLVKGVESDNNEEKLSDKNLKLLLGENMRTSVSRLETYAACPFYYYARYSLNAKARKIYEIQTPDLGSLFHSVLERFTETMKNSGLTWQTITDAEVKEITEAVIDEVAPDMSNRILLSTAAHTYLIRRIKRVTNRAVSILKSHMEHGKFETIGCEVGFGFENGDLPPIEITLDKDRKMILNGKIDRVDAYRLDGSSYVKIIDYKSGKKEFSLSDIYYGLQLQLLLYMDAIIKTGKVITVDQPQVAGAFYFKIMDPVIKASELNGREPERVMFKQFCMSGLVCDEEEVIKALDDIFEDAEGKIGSEIMNVSRSKDGKITGSAVSRSKYDKLMEYAIHKAGEIGKDIADGDVSIMPIINKGTSPCDYCEYSTVCCFDTRMGNVKNKLRHLSASDVWESVLSGKDDKNVLEKEQF